MTLHTFALKQMTLHTFALKLCTFSHTNARTRV